MNCNHPTTITVADCWTEERNDAGMNCYECEKCATLLEKHPSCDVHDEPVKWQASKKHPYGVERA